MPNAQGRPTLGDLIAEIEDDIERADLNQQVRIAVARAIREYQPDRFGWNERVLTFTTLAGTDVYGGGDLSEIPDLYAVDTMVLVENGQVWPLARVAEAAIETTQQDTAGGRPCRWSFLDRSIRLDPVPDGAYSIRLTGQIQVPAPATDDDTSPWVDEAGTLIAAWAKRHLAMNALRDDRMAARQDAAVTAAWRRLRGRANRIASAGVIRAHSL
ncbi:hypothetical protein [uncultured Methylobacterium sp.]|jgi:hypothetical protein|uniref:phage adaptor protein n=1 Tax=uncultured Methylobacterium sp. TaxID=157278 RepID=UPI0026191DDE|nr:hypothetical protein [uncultured Methylobacterium sp.]